MAATRKTTFSLMALTISAGIALSGCGGNKAETSSSQSPSAPASSSAAAATSSPEPSAQLEPYTLTMVYPAPNSADLKLVQDEMSKYLKEKINADIKLKPIDWGAWDEKRNLMFASNEVFDIVFTAGWNQYVSNALKNQFLDLGQLLDQYGEGIKETLGPDWLNGSQVKGKNYAVPTLKEFAGSAGVLMRKDLVDKYNIDLDAVNSLEDLEAVFKKIKDGEPGIIPLVSADGENLSSQLFNRMFDTVVWPGALDRDSSELKVINPYDSPKFKSMLATMRKWYKAGYINADASTMKADQATNLMKAGKAFAISAQLKPGKDKEMSISLGVDLVQKEFVKPLTTTGEATGAMLAISRTSKNPERAMMFLNLLYTDKYLLNLPDNGIEGKHFVKKSDTVIDFPQGVDSKTSGYVPGTAWMFGSQLNTYLWANEDPQKWANYKAFNDSAQRSPALGFSFDQEPVKNEVSAIYNVSKEFDTGLQTGTLDPDTYLPKYIDKMKSAGLDKVITEAQKQLDEWAQTKK